MGYVAGDQSNGCSNLCYVTQCSGCSQSSIDWRDTNLLRRMVPWQGDASYKITGLESQCRRRIFSLLKIPLEIMFMGCKMYQLSHMCISGRCTQVSNKSFFLKNLAPINGKIIAVVIFFSQSSRQSI